MRASSLFPAVITSTTTSMEPYDHYLSNCDVGVEQQLKLEGHAAGAVPFAVVARYLPGDNHVSIESRHTCW
jgi:hypothetical protein